MIAGWLVAWAASQHGDREAFIFEDRRFSFREANARANRLTNALRAAGIAPGERVGVLMRNSVEAVDANFGLLKGGFASVPLNDRQTPAEHADILNDGEVSAVLAGPGFEGAIAEAAVAAPSVRLVVGVGWGDADYGRFTAAASAEEPEVEVEPSSLMRLTYTSGSTGRPKGVVGTWRRFQARLDNFLHRSNTRSAAATACCMWVRSPMWPATTCCPASCAARAGSCCRVSTRKRYSTPSNASESITRSWSRP